MGRFSKVGHADLPERGSYLGKGNYTLEIVKCQCKRTRKQKDYFIVDFTVVASDNSEHPVGASRNWVQDMNADAGPGALKQFALAALGIDYRDTTNAQAVSELEDKMDDILTEAIVDPNDPKCKNGFKGLKVKCSVDVIITVEKKQEFNRHTFSPAA